ncbi:Peptidase B [Rhodovastum atsumiense]|uniref:Leucyl aminopeptidase family protein n=1 Tax=Rhodovastum atsumiense TaxID=504468 RepID=A0A5M6IZ85_9PROT|nr:leucyl aminopeptidase family protein [Rhodovastum atsumiense]KAA5613666.1 leucyl aminopeptidase family protein [Rhodovastum atsumiense]CAH2599579.1 Peptidase B [Rhodovastum atsumiense]
MPDRPLPVTTVDPTTRPVHAVRPGTLDAFLATRPPAEAAWLRGCGFTGRAQELVLLPGESGVVGAVLGLGGDHSPFAFGDLANRLPADAGGWRIEPGDFDPEAATLGFLLGAYRYDRLRPVRREPAQLAVTGHERALREAAATWMVRDLVNTPANLLGPGELAQAALDLGARHGASPIHVSGAALEDGYPAIAAVGRGSDRSPVVAGFTWQGSGATAASPLVSLCGKGVCFDSGGYDIKPSSAMLRMKKDMGGAASVLGLARLLMEADLPIRLAVRIGCVENAVSGRAMRPLDVIRTRRGLTVEIGNTDAEGRLVLCDLLAEASDERPDLLLDCATLTGAARVALGPDVPALFATDDGWAETLLAAGSRHHDPLWRLPLWDGYDDWLDSSTAEVNNVSAKPYAGAVVAALFMRRFLAPGTPWVHLDLYAWNDSTRPGKPEGGEAQSIRAINRGIENRIVVMSAERNTTVT